MEVFSAEHRRKLFGRSIFHGRIGKFNVPLLELLRLSTDRSLLGPSREPSEHPSPRDPSDRTFEPVVLKTLSISS